MRKFLALLVALSLLACAGSAFAAISTNPAAVNVTAGGTATATVTALPSHEGELGEISFSGPDWAKLDGTTITFAPDASVTPDTYTATVSVTESYGEIDDATGHTIPATETSTANITINVTAPVAPLTFTATPSTATIMATDSVRITFASTGGSGTKVFSLSPEAGTVDGLVFDGNTATFTPKVAGSYEIIFMVTDGDGRTQFATVTVTVAEILAASAKLSKNPVSVDDEVTITLTATGGIGASTFTAADETTAAAVTLSSTANNTATATYTASEAGVYALKFTAADTASHTATVNVSIIVDAPAPEPEKEDVVEEVVSEDVEETVTATVYELSGDLKKDVDEDTIANIMSKTAADAIASDDSYTSADKALAEGINERNAAAVDGLKNDGTFPADSENVGNDEIVITPTSGSEERLTELDTNAGRNGSAKHSEFNISNPTGKSGPLQLTLGRFARALCGLAARVYKIVTGGPSNNRAMPGFTAAADDDYKDTTIFLDSNGNVTTTIPTSVDVHGNPRISGYMTMVTYVEAGKDYDMIISIPTEDLQTAGIETTTKEVEVVMPTFSASGTSFFSTFVSSDLLTNTNYYRVGENVLTSKLNNTVVNSDWKRTEEELAMATNNNYTMITRLASMDASAEEDTHTYIVRAVFSADLAKRDRIDTTEEGGFIFYPNGPANAAVAAEVLKLVARDDGTYGFDDLTPADIKNGVTRGYLAFSITGGEAITKPMLAVKLLAAQTPVFAFALTKTSVTVKQGETETAEITPVNNSGDVTYTAMEGDEELDWITFNGDTATFAPTTSTAARTYNAYILGVDEAGAAYSQDISVVVTEAGSVTPPSPTTQLGLTASTSSLTMRVGQIETVTLTPSNLIGDATYTATADDEDAGVSIDGNVVTVEPAEVGTYTVTCTVVDSGRTTGSTATTSFSVVVVPGSVGGSGGGCDAGFGALALAVLGGFIAARKK